MAGKSESAFNLRLVIRPRETCGTLRHSEHAHLLSNIEKPALPNLGSMFPFWIPTGDLVCQLEATSRKVACRLFVASLQSTSLFVSQAEGEGAPLARCTWAVPAQHGGHGPGGGESHTGLQSGRRSSAGRPGLGSIFFCRLAKALKQPH